MAIDPQKISPTELVRLLNSTPLGMVTSVAKMHRQMNSAGLRIGDGRTIHLVRYVAWMAIEREKPKSPKLSVREARARDLAAKNAARKESQDIGEIPPVENPERREKVCKDFRKFCETYFPDIFYLPWSDDHLRVIERIETAVVHGGLFAFAMPRGSGKSVLSRMAALWAIITGRRRYVCLIGSAADQARNLLQGIQAVLLRPRSPLLADFPEAVHPVQALENSAHKQRGQRYRGELTFPIWTADKIVFPTIPDSPASGSVITVEGLDSNIRGQQHSTIDGQVLRPDLVLIDDPQTRESAQSLRQTANRLAILNGDVLGMAGPGSKISGLLTCTKIYAGDLADQLLDRKKNPEWQGQCTKMVYSFPADEKLWEQYAAMRSEELQAGGDGKEATEFYRSRQSEMDAGVKIAWPARYNEDEISAVQHAMNLKFRDREAFFAEYQNEPLTQQIDDTALTPEKVCQRFNGRKRCEVPISASTLTMFIDVHDAVLFYCVCAWEKEFTGYVIDYGTFPDQKRSYFSLQDAKNTLGRKYPGAGVEGAIQAGLEELVGNFLGKTWQRSGGGVVRIEKMLVDMGYKPGLVANVKHKAGGTAMVLSKGMGIRAGGRPMTAYRRHPGEVHGHNWYFPNVSKSSEFAHVAFDANYWKSFLHARLTVAPGDAGALTLFGKTPSEHALFANHIAASETWVLTHGQGRDVQEWKPSPSRPDNHWFDCLVGCAVAASISGIALPGMEAKPKRPRKKYTQEDFLRR
ncbi:MAG: phage terminase large subunit family protein [Planctomycetes bacterium]|nr:phage terminase large subunit family protein [Planctomycetota bacterium]